MVAAKPVWAGGHNVADNEQITRCQTPRLGYIAAQTDARQRMKQGQQQVFCKTCQRWKWPDELCEIAETES